MNNAAVCRGRVWHSTLWAIQRGLLLLWCVLCVACGGGASGASNSDEDESEPIAGAFAQLHQWSEQLYDGNGSWGHMASGYRMALRDSYWRALVYAQLVQAGHEQEVVFAQRVSEVADYLIAAQDAAGTGVFGFPADINNPEFGALVATIVESCPTCVHNGWIATLPDPYVEELYYDHGYALAVLASIQAQTPRADVLAAIVAGADWSLDKPLSDNINYLSALSKGLCYAYEVTGNAAYFERAVALHSEGILPFLVEGQAVDVHNAQLEYHGFIVSGLIALRRVMPASHALSVTLDQHLAAALDVMAARDLSASGAYGETWPGTNVLAWYELSQWRPLDTTEQMAVARIVQLINGYADDIESEDDAFRFQKALYSYFFIGLF